MKKASNILLTIGGIFHIVNGVAFILASFYFLAGAIAFFVYGQTWFIQIVDDEMAAEIVNLSLTISAVMLIVLFVMFIGFGVLSFIASKYTFVTKENNEKRRLIACIVFGAILDNAAVIVGSIFGLIVANKEKQEIE